MNKVVLVGRLTNDLELKTVGQGASVVTFNIAVDRRFKNQRGERETDFIRCVAWQKTAEFIAKYFEKGNKIGLVGEIQTRNFDGNDGKKVYITEVKVDEAHFVESKQQNQSDNSYNGMRSPVKTNQFDDGGGLPFSL